MTHPERDVMGAGGQVLRRGLDLLCCGCPGLSRVWHGTGVVDAITAAGRSVIAADRRGSGRSARPRDPRAYRGNACARDVTSLIDHLRLGQVDLAGYSVGSMIGLGVLQADPRGSPGGSRRRRR